jgi:hypothetical protein
VLASHRSSRHFSYDSGVIPTGGLGLLVLSRRSSLVRDTDSAAAVLRGSLPYVSMNLLWYSWDVSCQAITERGA